MTWLRLLSPFYALRIEREHARLAQSAARLAASTKSLADGNELRRFAEAETIRDAAVALRGIHGALQTIAVELESGRTNDAKILVDALILVLMKGGI